MTLRAFRHDRFRSTLKPSSALGIDLLDITFRIEKVFHVRVTMDDLSGLMRGRDITVGDLYELVLKKLNLHDVGRNSLRLNYQLWSEMQSVLHFVTDMPLHQIRLDLSLETLFPREIRRTHWNALRATCPYRVPELDYPKFVRVGAFLLAGAVVFIEQRQIWQIRGMNWLWPLLGLASVWMFSETYLKVLSVCAPFRNRVPDGLRTAKDLCRQVLAVNYAKICENIEQGADQRCPAVWQELVELLVAALGVGAHEVTFRSRLFHDLGAE